MQHLSPEDCICIIDIGSNSIRMVIYDEICRFPRIVLDEKAECHLADGVAISKILKEENVNKAIENIRRFAALLDYSKINNRFAIATSACREAENAGDFIKEVEELLKTKVNLISGEREAALSALGVLMEQPDARGIVADIGGGSLELSSIDDSVINNCNSYRLGYHSLFDLELEKNYSSKEMEDYIQEILAEDQSLNNSELKSVYLVGGRWKRLARLHMESNNYPLKIVSNYSISAEEVDQFLEFDEINSTLRFAALLLKTLIKVSSIKKLIFCTNGIREGFIYTKLNSKQKQQDPLPESIIKITKLQAKMLINRAKCISDWVLSSGFINLASSTNIDIRKMIYASSVLIQGFIFNNKEQKSTAVFNYIINLNLPNLIHEERIFLAYILFCSLAGNKTNKEIKKYLTLLDFPIIKKAKKIGYFLRLAIHLSPGDSKLLKYIDLNFNSQGLEFSTSKKKLQNLFLGNTLHDTLIELENLIEY